MQEDR